MAKLIDLTNKRFDKLTVIDRADDLVLPSGKRIAAWLCLCDCGNKIIARGDYLRNETTRHCGCDRKGSGVGKANKLNKYVIVDGYVIGTTTNTHNEFYIDVDDVDKVKKYSWYENDEGYLISRINNKLVRMHRLIMDVKDKKMIVYHINHNTLDNRKVNLRIASRSQNNMNKIRQSNNTSGVTGVTWDNKRKKWRAYIKVNSSQNELGYYDNFNDAVNARKNAEDKYFGEYSYDNSIERVV